MSTGFEQELRTLMREAVPALSPPPDLPAVVAARGRRRRAGGALAVAGAVLAVVAAWHPVTGGSGDAHPAASGRTVELGRVGVRVPAGWSVSEQPPATWCDARPRTVYLGGTLLDPADVAPAGAAAPCPHPIPEPVVWVGRAGLPMSAPLPLVRLPGGALGRVELTGITGGDGSQPPQKSQASQGSQPPQGSPWTGRYLVVSPAGDGVQLVATLPDAGPDAPLTVLTADVDAALRRISIGARPLAARPAPLVGALAVVTDNRPTGAPGRSRTIEDDRTLAALDQRLQALPGAVVDPADGCFSAVAAIDVTDLTRGDRVWREFSRRWPGMVFLPGGHEVLVGGEGCRYVVDSEGGAAGWSPGLLDDLIRLAGGPGPAG